MNFKRKHRRSSTMKKCSICGSQRRLYGDINHRNPRYNLLKKELRETRKSLVS